MKDENDSARSANESDDGSKYERLAYLFFLSRPRFWLYLAGPVLVGVAYAASSIDELVSPTAVILFLYFLVPANVFLYGINDIFDADIDAENPKKEEREVRYGGGRVVPVAVAVCAIMGIAIAFALPFSASIWVLAFLVLAITYSAPPIRFKAVPLLDSISNGLYFMPGAAAYVAIAGGQPPLSAIVGAWFWTMAMHTFSAIPDIEPDRRAGIRTTATVLRQRGTLAYCAGCWLLSAIAFGLLDLRLGALFAIYPALVGWIAVSGVDVDRAYWWFPWINGSVGAVFTMGGLWLLVG